MLLKTYFDNEGVSSVFTIMIDWQNCLHKERLMETERKIMSKVE